MGTIWRFENRDLIGAELDSHCCNCIVQVR
jgi:hypothetical protein